MKIVWMSEWPEQPDEPGPFAIPIKSVSHQSGKIACPMVLEMVNTVNTKCWHANS